jgi:aldehyde dehydrogenase (NAD+)
MSYPLESEEKLKKIFDTQRNYFLTHLKTASISDRIEKLKKIKNWIEEHKTEILTALYQDLRKPEVEADITDIKPVLWEIDLACKNLHRWTKPKKVKSNLAFIGTKAKIVYQPLGVVLILAPWNFPFNLTIGPLVSAIAAGNCAIVKPSELTPATSDLIKKLVNDLFEGEEIEVCLGDHSIAENLLRLPFNHIFFTGSPGVGKKVMKAAAEHLSSITLELGGCNPAIVDATCDINDAAEKVVFGKFLNSGQSCLSINYLFVDKSIHSEFVKAVVEKYNGLFPKEDLAQHPELSCIINKKHYDRIQELIRLTESEGAEILLSGINNKQYNFISPVILNHVPHTAPVLYEEIFGPVLPIVPYSNLEEVLDFLNKQQSPLALYIFSKSKKNIEGIIQNTSAGTSCVNDTTLQFVHPYLPFGGVNHSGIGKSHGYHGFLAFTNERSIIKQRIGFTSFKLIYPPYTERVKQIKNLIMKYL